MTKRIISASEAIDGPRESNWRGCCWPSCTDPVDRRFNLPMCFSHATQAANRVNIIDPTHGEDVRRQHDLTEIERLRGQVRTMREKLIRYERAEEPPPAKKARQQPKDGVVYYLENGRGIKIGWTSNLERRMKNFYPDSRLLAVEPGRKKLEHRRHRMFAAHRTHGREWYAPVPSLRHHIDMIKKEHGEPPDITVGANPVTIPQPRDPQYIGGPSLGNPARKRVVRG